MESGNLFFGFVIGSRGLLIVDFLNLVDLFDGGIVDKVFEEFVLSFDFGHFLFGIGIDAAYRCD